MNAKNHLVSPAASHRLSCALLFLLALASPGLKAQDEEALTKRFQEEAPRAWKAFLAHGFELRGRITMVKTTAGKETTTFTQEVKEKPGYHLLESQEDDSESGTTKYSVRARNPNYVFFLQRKSAASSWVLTDMVVKPPEVGSRLLPNQEDLDKTSSCVQSPLISDRWILLSDLVQLPSFRLIHATPVSQEGSELVRIEFDNRHPIGQDRFDPVQSGTLLLDPARSWCLRGFEIQTEYANSRGQWRSDVVAVRDSSVPHFPLPVRLAETETSVATQGPKVGQTFISTIDMRYDLEEPQPAPDGDFRLSAFGLPEPEGPATRPWWWLWAVGASLLCIAAAGVGWWSLRRRAPKPAA